MAKIFRQHDRVALFIEASGHQRFFSAEDRFLARVGSHRGYPFAFDSSASVLSEQGGDASNSQFLYTVYGFGWPLSDDTLRIGFKGEVLYAATASYFLGGGQRLYMPRIMRFNAPDKLSVFVSGEINSYAFCSGDPVNFSDPSGQARVSASVAANRPQRGAAKITPVKLVKTAYNAFRRSAPSKVSVTHGLTGQDQVTNLADVTRSFKPEEFTRYFKKNYPGDSVLRDAVSATNAMSILATPPQGNGLLATVSRFLGRGGFGGAVNAIDFRGVTSDHARDIRNSMRAWEGNGDWYYSYMTSADFPKIMSRYQWYRSRSASS